jgi:signal transduction histidine kinase/ActR/RegA family two-component response regulator
VLKQLHAISTRNGRIRRPERLLTVMLAIVSVALVPALGLQIYTETEVRRIRQQVVEDDAVRLVHLVASEERRIVEGAEEALKTISASPAVRAIVPEACQLLLLNLVGQSPRYTAAAVIDRDGHPVCASGHLDPSTDASDRGLYRLALQTGGFVVGAYPIGHVTGPAAIHMARPFLNQAGMVAGVVDVALSISWLGQQLGGVALPPGATASIADRNGIILASAPDGAGLLGTPALAEGRFSRQGNESRAASLVVRDDPRHIVAYSAPGANPAAFLISVAVERDVTFAAMTQANQIGFALIILGDVLALAATAFLGARLIGRPVRRLLMTADRWRIGDLAARSGLRKDSSEFGRLAAGFDEMAAALGEREAALHRLTNNLEARVQEEVAAREAAQARAAHAERVQALGQLAGGIAHDFNNVLQAVEGAAALIERRMRSETDVRRLVRIVLDASERGASITRRLLAFGRRGDLHAEAQDVVALLTGMHEILAHTLGAAIEVGIKLGAGLPPVFADKGQVETVLVNLATNGRDAMPEGGRLTLSADTEFVPPSGLAHPFGLASGRYVRLSVTDTGVGMEPATLARLGEPFFTTKGVGVGTGLGLPMAKGFAEQSGGALRVESIPGKGTTVTLWLPAAAPIQSTATAASHDAAGATADETSQAPALTKVLLVDDERLVRETLTESLQDAGYDVLVAEGGTRALGLLAAAGVEVDILVTDLSMPGMDGLGLIRAAQEGHPGLPAVLLTGYAKDSTTLAMGGAITGSFSLLRKPIRIHELDDRIRALLARRKKVA